MLSRRRFARDTVAGIAASAAMLLFPLTSLAAGGAAAPAMPRHPSIALTRAGDGNYYGVSEYGGANDNGCIYRVTPAGEIAVVYSFSATSANGANSDGASPDARLVVGVDGSLYGVTRHGGSSGYGTAFRLNPVSGALASLVSFTGKGGAHPGYEAITLLQGKDGNLYGTTQGGTGGGENGLGTVFRLNPTTGECVNVVDFTGYSGDVAGFEPTVLVQGSDGRLYGVTESGGTGGGGTVFAVDPATGAFRSFMSFPGAGVNRGGSPSTLIQGRDGNLYGTTQIGGTGNNGTVFRVVPSTGEFTSIVSFTGLSGAHPGYFPTTLIAASDGNLYGSTKSGGMGNAGTVFRLNPASGEFTSLASFTGTSGASPGYAPAALLQTGSSDLYGVTQFGGIDGDGTVFRIRLDTGAFASLASFAGSSRAYRSSFPTTLFPADDGDLLGTTLGDGKSDAGSVFRLSPASGSVSTLALIAPQ